MKGNTKKVYKANKKLLKRLVVGIILIALVIILAKPVKNTIELIYLKTWKTYDINAFNFSYKLPRAYKEQSRNDDDKFGLNSSAFMSEYSVEVNSEYVSQKPTIVYDGGNILNGISVMIECLQTSKTDMTLEEIAENYYSTVSLIYEENYTIIGHEFEFVNVMENDSIKSIITLKKGESTKKMVTYLIPTDDKEITITFLGKAENIDSNMDEIEKIIKTIK